jgi:hypothetical protein
MVNIKDFQKFAVTGNSGHQSWHLNIIEHCTILELHLLASNSKLPLYITIVQAKSTTWKLPDNQPSIMLRNKYIMLVVRTSIHRGVLMLVLYALLALPV